MALDCAPGTKGLVYLVRVSGLGFTASRTIGRVCVAPWRLVSVPSAFCNTEASKFACRLSGLGFGVWGLGFGVWGLQARTVMHTAVSGEGKLATAALDRHHSFRVSGFGFRIWGLGFSTCTPLG
jgi:hypothetical protein